MSTYQPSEAEWNAYGTLFAATRFGTRVVRAALCGIQAFMTIDCISTYLTMPKERRKGHLRLLVFSGVILIATSINLAFDIWVVFGFRCWKFEYACDDPWWCHGGRVSGFWGCSFGGVIIIPFLACIVSNVGRIISLVVMTRTSFRPEGTAALASVVAESLSVFMKVMVTYLILFQLLRTWLIMSRTCPNLQRSRTYSRVAGILIESAAPLAVFGICFVTAIAINYYRKPQILARRGTLNALTEVSSSLYYSFSMIIYRVLNGQSWKNARESNELTEKLSTGFQFTRPCSSSTDEMEAEGALSQCPRTSRDVKLESTSYGGQISEEARDRRWPSS
ncbi:hypothetical protein BKA70DRAFT_1535713 [Coprinopsis sp. MPI-PUGE-AT-0042]|nr:hypothetical protein BKA70DRAFT_1535713 [Coprinopsis sp. MPI-PUGE-AT-0042]